MSDLLSNSAEQFIAEAMASGRFPSRDAVLEAALLELRAAEGDEGARLALCERAVDSIAAGLGKEATPEYWDDLRRRIHDAASGARRES